MRISVIILAAGLGTRMRTTLPKVVHPLLGKPMIQHVCDAAKKLKPERIIVVTNQMNKELKRELSSYDVDIAVQRKPLGTADAVKSALPFLDGVQGTVLLLNGDTPLLQPSTLKRFLSQHRKERSLLSILSFFADDPSSYGRIVRDSAAKPYRIVEERDLVGNEGAIKEVNSGIYAMELQIANLLSEIKINRKKREYYLTDILDLAVGKNLRCAVLNSGKEEEFLGVNTQYDLYRVESIMQRNIINKFMEKGVRFCNPGSVIVHSDVKVGSNTVIYPCVYLEGRTVIGNSSKIFSGVRIVDSKLGSNVTILDNSLIESSRIGDYAVVGPCAHLRPNSIVGKGVKIGNFVELKNARLSDGVKASHLSYIGDATLAENVNVGAGTITCNYDGFRKHRTKIAKNVFIGSDTQLIAPLTIGEGAYIAAGSTITNDVPPHALAMSRVKQTEIPKWTKKKKGKRKK